MKDSTFPSGVAPTTLVELMRWRGIHQPNQRAYTFLEDGEVEETHLTYSELDCRAQAIAAYLQRLDMTGRRALLLYPPGLEYISAFFGCLYAGVIAVPAYPPRLNRPMHRLQVIAADAEATVALTTSQILSKLERRLDQTTELRELRWLDTGTVTNDLAEVWQAPAVNQDSLAFLQYTSGSTSTPKGVMVSHGNLLYNLALIHRCFGHTPESVGVIWLPPYHDMGLIGGILQPLYGGFPVVLMAPVAFLQKPARWLQAISRYRATASGGPNFAYDLCAEKITAEQRTDLDLSSWQIAFSGAEPVRNETMERFARAFEPYGFRREVFYPCYGLAEATLIVSGGQKATGAIIQSFETVALSQKRIVEQAAVDGGRVMVSCGQTLSGQQIVIADPDSLRQCPADRVGEIWVSGPSVAQGYWRRVQETDNTFRAYLADTGAGPFLRTGDLGFLREGELFVTGRLKDLIIIRGRNLYPQDIELTVTQSHPDLQADGGAAFTVNVEGEERLVVVQEVKRTQRDTNVDEVIQVIRQAVTEEHEIQVYAVVLVKPMTIAKTSSGKIQRHVCREQFLAGSLQTIGSNLLEETPAEALSNPIPLDESFIRKALTAVTDFEARRLLLTLYLQEQTARVLRLSPSAVDVRHSLSALGLDSLKAIELTFTIETNLGVVLPMVDLFQEANISQLVAQILTKLEEGLAQPIIQPRQEDGPNVCLSRGQRAMWFLHRLAPESAAYHIVNAARIRMEVDVPALTRSFQKLIDRHPSLRTTFPIESGEPIQRLNAQAEVCFCYEEKLGWDEVALNKRLSEAAGHPFDLEHGPLLRVHLFQLAAQEYILLLAAHHIVVDFWSLAVLVEELGKLYEAERLETTASLPPLSLQYTDYVHWQAEMLAGPQGETLAAYWQEQLAGELPTLDLPTDRPRPAIQTYRGASRSLKISPSLLKELKALGRTYGATLYVVLLAAFQVLLHRYTKQQDILVGSPTAGRSRAELAGLVGYFVNPVVLRARFEPELAFSLFLEQVRQTVLAAFAHQDYPFDLLVERLQPKRDLSRPPIFQVMFTLQQSPLLNMEELASFALGEAGAQAFIDGLQLESVALERRTAQFDLALAAAETAQGLVLSIEYNKDLFEVDTIDSMLTHLQSVLTGIASAPQQRISDLPFLGINERRQLLEEWNNTEMDYDRSLCLPQMVTAQAERTPNAVALVVGNEQLTYRQLEQRTNRLARYLRDLGVKPGVYTGICVERSLEMVVGLLGILKAGGTYIPLDPAYPAERIEYVLTDAQSPVLLTQERLLAKLPPYNGQIVCLDIIQETILPQISEAALQVEMDAAAPAYAIYTSGSTGRPKGVLVPHRAAHNFLESMKREPGFTCRDVLLAVTTLSFDIAGLELFLPLVTGGQVVLAGQEEVADGVRLAKLIAHSGATVMQATPATWRLLLETGWSGNPRLKVLCGGEAFPRDLANRLKEKTAEVWNMYGPTETTIWSAVCRIEAGDGPVWIGRPIGNTQLYILDERLQPAPVGVWGELYIGGDGVALGYINRPDLTAEKFIPHPFPVPRQPEKRGTRMYRTGDIVRYRRDGQIEFLGRIDHQVKIRGYRIEIGEIENVLGQHPLLQAAVVTVWENNSSPGGNKQLVAYMTANNGHPPTVNELRRFLKDKLPDYMIPSLFLFLESLPLTPNGKIDRKALPRPEQHRPELEMEYVAPKSELERRIAEIWQEVLAVEKVGVYDNFFELGGHSLSMAQAHIRLQNKLERQDLSMVELFQYPTISSLAKYLGQTEASQFSNRVSQSRVDVRRARSTSLNQQRQRRRETRSGEDK